MKKKTSKILGVSLTLVMVLSLTFAFSAAPVSADPDVNEWSKFAYPSEGAKGDWFWEDSIGYVGPIAMAIDGTLYCASDAGGDENLFKSDDSGRTWSLTDYQADVDGDYIVDIVCDSEDANIVYVADANYVYWSEDGGDNFAAIAPHSLYTQKGDEVITSLDVGYIGGDPYVFISTSTWSGGGSVYFINLESYLAGWIDMDIQSPYSGYDAYAVNCAPDFDDSHKLFAVVSGDDPDDTVQTLIVTNTGVAGIWSKFGADLEKVGGGAMEIEGASDICFPDDFDHDELFVGVCGTGGAVGSVYRVIADIAYAYCLGDWDSDVAVDIISLQLTGYIGATLLLAGAEDTNDVFYSTDDGESWDAATKPPSGVNTTYVLMAEDFADSGEAWAATSGDEAAVSYTIDGGDLFNQISLIGTDMDDWILSFSHYPDYEDSEKLFMVTTEGFSSDSLWRYDGEYWERVAESGVLDADIELAQVSPEILTDDTVFFVDYDPDDPVIFRSTDEGQSWDELRCQPDELIYWVVIDADTILAGGWDGTVYKTDRHGARVWEDIDADITGSIMYFARFGDTILCGSIEEIDGGEYEGKVAISEDLGDSWDMVGDPLPDDAPPFVAFDTGYADNSFIYAACETNIYRFEVDESDDWEDIDGGVAIELASGIATADGCLYVSDFDDGAGMWRSVDPTADEPLFEQVGDDFGLDADANIWHLQTTSGSNVLWALDDETYDDRAALWTYEVTVLPLTIEIDIKPGSDPNSINLKSKGVVPVAVLTTDDFDASTVDPDTVVFAGADPVRWTMEDVDEDEDDDMLFHFKTQELELEEDSTEATLTGKTLGGIDIKGTDTVNIVPKKGK